QCNPASQDHHAASMLIALTNLLKGLLAVRIDLVELECLLSSAINDLKNIWENNLQWALIWNSMGNIHQTVGNVGAAVTCYAKALCIRESSLGAENTDTLAS
ncbi:unnamed protein product, partial [Ostreobium quekettii]